MRSHYSHCEICETSATFKKLLHRHLICVADKELYWIVLNCIELYWIVLNCRRRRWSCYGPVAEAVMDPVAVAVADAVAGAVMEPQAVAVAVAGAVMEPVADNLLQISHGQISHGVIYHMANLTWWIQISRKSHRIVIFPWYITWSNLTWQISHGEFKSHTVDSNITGRL